MDKLLVFLIKVFSWLFFPLLAGFILWLVNLYIKFFVVAFTPIVTWALGIATIVAFICWLIVKLIRHLNESDNNIIR